MTIDKINGKIDKRIGEAMRGCVYILIRSGSRRCDSEDGNLCEKRGMRIYGYD